MKFNRDRWRRWLRRLVVVAAVPMADQVIRDLVHLAVGGLGRS